MRRTFAHILACALLAGACSAPESDATARLLPSATPSRYRTAPGPLRTAEIGTTRSAAGNLAFMVSARVHEGQPSVQIFSAERPVGGDAYTEVDLAMLRPWIDSLAALLERPAKAAAGEKVSFNLPALIPRDPLSRPLAVAGRYDERGQLEMAVLIGYSPSAADVEGLVTRNDLRSLGRLLARAADRADSMAAVDTTVTYRPMSPRLEGR